MRIASEFPSVDGITTKYLLDAGDALIECTHVNRVEKHIVCFSTAVGCPIHCRFCAAGDFRRQLSAKEMVAQVLAVTEAAVPLDTQKRILFSAMGEGEPLLSENAAASLIDALDQLTAAHPGSRAAVSTSAIRPAVVRWLANAAPFGLKLQISLHGVTDAQRQLIIPLCARLMEVVEAGREFVLRRPGRLEWNYVLIAGLNDSDEDAGLLAELIEAGGVVKLNRLNPVPGLVWQPSERASAFAGVLRDRGLRPELYCTDGVDVAAACGQLRSRMLGTNVRRQDSAGDREVVP